MRAATMYGDDGVLYQSMAQELFRDRELPVPLVFGRAPPWADKARRCDRRGRTKG